MPRLVPIDVPLRRIPITSYLEVFVLFLPDGTEPIVVEDPIAAEFISFEIEVTRAAVFEFVTEYDLRIAPTVPIEFIQEVAAEQFIPSSTPVAYWKLNTTSWVDEIAGNNLTVASGSATTATGFDGNALRMTANGTRLRAPAVSTFSFGNINWSTEFRFRINNANYFDIDNVAIVSQVDPTNSSNFEWRIVAVIQTTQNGSNFTDRLLIHVSLRGTPFGGSGTAGQTCILDTGLLNTAITQTWFPVAVTYVAGNETQRQLTISFNNVVQAYPIDQITPETFSGTRFQLGDASPKATINMLFDELKLFKP